MQVQDRETSIRVPDHLRDLFEKPIVCALTTVMPDGTPQTTPVWCDYDGEFVRVNTARGRQKDRNMSKRSKVTVLLIDPHNPYHWMEIRGHIVEETENGGYDHINQLSHKYKGRDYPKNPGEIRVMYKIQPDKINGR
jgi:PPOX class probable F420-dependent enzyme